MFAVRSCPVGAPAAATYGIAPTKWRAGVQKPRVARYSRAMTSLTATEKAAIERAADAPMLPQVEKWAAINRGTGTLAGLKRVAGELAAAFSALPRELRLVAAHTAASAHAARRVHTIPPGALPPHPTPPAHTR